MREHIDCSERAAQATESVGGVSLSVDARKEAACSKAVGSRDHPSIAIAIVLAIPAGLVLGAFVWWVFA